MMTPKERIKVHAEIEAKNRENVTRWKAKRIYREFVRNGQFCEGRMILELLRYGSITLRLYDEDWNVQTALKKAGFHVWYSRNGIRATAYI